MSPNVMVAVCVLPLFLGQTPATLPVAKIEKAQRLGRHSAQCAAPWVVEVSDVTPGSDVSVFLRSAPAQ